VPPREATGYGRRGGAIIVAPRENMPNACGDGGL
jgi:hypothetical protein